MSLLDTIKNTSTADVKENQTDTLGGGGVLESGAYDFTITMAYLQPSAKGALGLTLWLDDGQGHSTRQTIYVTSGNDKGNKPYYEKDGEKKFLPGYNTANAICMLTCEKELGEMDTDEKVVKIFSFDAGAEVPTKVEVLSELLNQPITLGIQKQIQDKNVKGDDGKYYPSGETREVNEIDKVFHTDTRMTIAEARARLDDENVTAKFYETWVEKWTGKTRDRSTKSGATSGAPKGESGGYAGTTAGKPKVSMFNKKQ